MPGHLITFEGGDGAGKSTLIGHLYEWLQEQGRDVITTRAPGSTTLGQEIRQWLLHGHHMDARAELLLFLADRAQHVHEIIAPALSRGAIVLCDRFNDSTVAYQGAARQLSEEVVRSFCAFASYDTVPDLTFYLDLDPAIARLRLATKDRLESESQAFHANIRASFQNMVKNNPHRFVSLDATLPIPTLVDRAKEKLDAFFHAPR